MGCMIFNSPNKHNSNTCNYNSLYIAQNNDCLIEIAHVQHMRYDVEIKKCACKV